MNLLVFSIFVQFKIYKIDNSENYTYSKPLKFDVSNSERTLTHVNEIKREYIFLSLIDKDKINLTIVAHDQATDSWLSPSFRILELSNYMPETNVNSLNQAPMLNMNLTAMSSHLALIVYSNIIFINVSNRCIIAEKSFENNTNLSYVIMTVPNTDNVVAVLNNETIFYFVLNSDNTIDMISHKFSSSFRELKIFKNLLIVLTEMVGDKTELAIYDLGRIKEQKIVDEPFFRQSFLKLTNYCVNEDCNYLTAHEKSGSLSLYRLKGDFKRIARIPPYNNLNALIATQDFIVLSVEGTRIISFLIVDPNESHHASKISQLNLRLIFVNY